MDRHCLPTVFALYQGEESHLSLAHVDWLAVGGDLISPVVTFGDTVGVYRFTRPPADREPRARGLDFPPAPLPGSAAPTAIPAGCARSAARESARPAGNGPAPG